MRGQELMRLVPAHELVPDGSTLDDFLAVGHGAGIGMTGGGKTEAIRWFAASTRFFVITFNPEAEPMPGVRVGNVDELWEAMEKRERRVNYVPPEGHESVHLEAIKRLLFRVGDQMRHARGGKKTPPWCLLLVDEVHRVSEKSDRDGTLHDLLKLGRKRGICTWVFSQEPSEVAHVCLTQPQVFLLWEVKAFRVPYLEDYGVPMSLVWDHVQKPHHVAIFVKNRYALCPPLPLA